MKWYQLLFGAKSAAAPELKNLEQARTSLALAQANGEKVVSLFTAAGLDLEAIMAKGDNGLKDHLASLSPAPAQLTAEHPEVAALITAATGPLNEQITTLTGQLSTANSANEAGGIALKAATARADLFTTALATAGIKPVAADPKAGLTAAEITTAIEARVSTKAGELTATLGQPPVVSAPPADNSKPAAAKTELKGLARTQAAFAAQRQARA